MKTPEFYEKQAIREYLDSIGAWHFLPLTYGYGPSGVPDIVGCYKTNFFSVEVKRPGKSPTIRQNQRMNEIKKHGGAVFAGDAAIVIPQLERWKNALC